jgi:hypothetical protein
VTRRDIAWSCPARWREGSIDIADNLPELVDIYLSPCAIQFRQARFRFLRSAQNTTVPTRIRCSTRSHVPSCLTLRSETSAGKVRNYSPNTRHPLESKAVAHRSIWRSTARRASDGIARKPTMNKRRICNSPSCESSNRRIVVGRASIHEAMAAQHEHRGKQQGKGSCSDLQRHFAPHPFMPNSTQRAPSRHKLPQCSHPRFWLPGARPFGPLHFGCP